MKKNTKELERAEIMFLDKMLPNIGSLGADARSFLANPFHFSICVGKYGKRAEQNNTYWCSDCGGQFSLSEVKDYRKNPECKVEKYPTFGLKRTHLGTCPICGKPMKIDHWRYKKQTFDDVVSFKATMGEWKITRYFSEKTYCRPGHKAEIILQDIGADWTKGEYTYSYIARQGGMYYSKHWKPETRHFAECRKASEWSEEGQIVERYDMPEFSLDAELERRGILLDNLHGMKLTQILNYMNENPHFETLWKQGDWAIARFFKRDLYYYWSQIRIARKHGFALNEDNLTEWRDLIELLRRNGKDIYNPKFICPADLHEAHNVELEERRRRDEREREQWRRRQDEWARQDAEERMKDALKEEEKFKERREKYFGISIPGNGFTIVALKSIDEFRHEGDTLHHCVFRCGYYSKAYSLILSARDADDNPIETIEIDLQGFRINQCYGDHDTHTALHDAIIDTMMENMWQVKDIALGKVAMAS